MTFNPRTLFPQELIRGHPRVSAQSAASAVEHWITATREATEQR
jgi:hypothetical protein